MYKFISERAKGQKGEIKASFMKSKANIELEMEMHPRRLDTRETTS